MASFSIALIAALAVAITASSLREKRQAYYGGNNYDQGVVDYQSGNNNYYNNNQCPQGEGPHPHPSDCKRFLQCNEGVTREMSCTVGLVFNPAKGVCDFPLNVPGCQNADPNNAPCLDGNPMLDTLAPHGQWCNAFVHCGQGYKFPGCTFCGEGLYFSRTTRHCEPISEYFDQGNDCGGLPIIDPRDEVVKLLDASCQPSGNDTFAPLLAKILGGGYNNNNNNYPYNYNNNNNNYPYNNNNNYPYPTNYDQGQVFYN